MDQNPYEAPRTSPADLPESVMYTPEEIENISFYFNMMITFFLIMMISGAMHSLILAILLKLGYVFGVYFLVKSMCKDNIWLYVLMSFIPLINLIMLVVLIRQASAVLKRHGFRIGLLGSRKEDRSFN